MHSLQFLIILGVKLELIYDANDQQ